jgi:hypothetical protein
LFTLREHRKIVNVEGAMDREDQTLNDAITALQATVGFNHVKVDVQPLPVGDLRADALLTITVNGHKQHFVAEIKTVDRHIAVAQIQAQLQALIQEHYPDYRPLLVTAFATTAMAEECRRLDLPFMDTVGNLYLPTDHFVADIRGKARPVNPLKDTYRANHPAGLKITFALLCKPELAAAPYREIVKYARVALGAIGPVINDLTQRGYLRHGKTPTGALLRKKELLNEWVTYYPATLRPTLRPRRYQADRELLTGIDLEPFGAYWGGEYGAEKLTRYLKAEHFLIYAPGAPPTAMMTQARLRLATDGNTELLETFWNPDLVAKDADIAPPLLIYADLMATADERNLETAKEVYERFLAPTLNRP